MFIILFYKFWLVLGIVVVMSIKNWFLVWSSLELVTALLVAIMGYKSTLSPRSVEGMTKYFIVQSMAGIFLLVGMVSRYYLVGTLELFSSYNSLSYGFMLVGLLMKVGLFPNPFWFVDTMSGLKLFAGFYLITSSKMIPVYLFTVLIKYKESYPPFLLVVGLGSVALGCLLGLNQSNVRKIMALSSISHMGWFLLGLPWLNLGECLFVFCSYLLMVSIMVLIASYYCLDNLTELNRIYMTPWGLFLVMLSLLSLGGFPPLMGFFYKMTMFLGLVSGGSYLVCGYLIVMSLISLFYYLRICYNLYSLYVPEVKYIVTFSFSLVKTDVMFNLMMIVLSLIVMVSFACLGLILV